MQFQAVANLAANVATGLSVTELPIATFATAPPTPRRAFATFATTLSSAEPTVATIEMAFPEQKVRHHND
jgi:hypothetical protein